MKDLNNLKIKCGFINCHEKSIAINGYCSTTCRNKTRSMMKIVNIRLQAIEYLGGKCKRCNFEELTSVLCFHHLDPFDKVFEISKFLYRGLRYITPELDKCVLLCKNCHDVVHSTKDPAYFNLNRYCFGTNSTNFETVPCNMGKIKCTTDCREITKGAIYSNEKKKILIPRDTIIHS